MKDKKPWSAGTVIMLCLTVIITLLSMLILGRMID